MLKFQNFGRTHGQPCLPAPFSRAVGQKSKFRSQHFFALLSPFPKRYDTTPLPQYPGRRYIWQKTHFSGSGPDPEGLGVQINGPKITCKEISGPWKFDHNLAMGSKVISNCSGHRRTDRQTDRQTHILNSHGPLREFFFWNYFMHWRDVKLWTLRNSYHFTSWSLLRSLHSLRKSVFGFPLVWI